MVENGKFLKRLRNVHLEKSVATGICRVQRSPKTAKTPLKVHLRLRFQNLGKPRTAGLCGRAAGACDCGLLSCAFIERVNRGRKPPKRGMAGRETRIPKGSVSHRRSGIHRVFSHIAHKRRNVRFKGARRVPATPAPNCAHSGSHAETRGVLDGGGITTLGAFCAVRKPCVAGCQNGKLCRFWALVGCAPEERGEPAEQRCVHARRCPEASRPRWAA